MERNERGEMIMKTWYDKYLELLKRKKKLINELLEIEKDMEILDVGDSVNLNIKINDKETVRKFKKVNGVRWDITNSKQAAIISLID